jgi:hypothetical protein
MITGDVARAMILKEVARQLKAYILDKKAGETPHRVCICGCKSKFNPRHGYHFYAGPDCRRRMNRGWIRPRTTD